MSDQPTLFDAGAQELIRVSRSAGIRTVGTYVDPVSRKYFKKCGKCKKIKGFDEFNTMKGGNHGKYAFCKGCCKAKNREYQDRTRQGLKMYGLSKAEFDEKLRLQNGVCAICKKPEVKRNHHDGRINFLSVDHNHETGSVRGLLCDSCNVVLGRARDNPELLEEAARYLRTYAI
jgi:hypothetical protein